MYCIRDMVGDGVTAMDEGRQEVRLVSHQVTLIECVSAQTGSDVDDVLSL